MSVATLPPVRGRLTAGAALAPLVWFKSGGAAEWLFEPADADDLAAFLAALDPGVPVLPLGLGSNLIVRDGGVRGVTIRLGKAFAQVEPIGDSLLRCGGGASGILVSSTARDAGVAGVEFLRSIPGTVGGFVRMNGGAYGRETADVLVEAEVVLRDGTRRTLSRDALGYSYRHSALPEGAVVVGATFRGVPGAPAAIQAEMDRIAAAREASQPLRSRTGGSTFKNPPGAKAWELVDAAGCRGLRRGDAQVSEKHTNFLLNLGAASSAEIEALGEDVRARVRAASGVELEWEIQRVGDGQNPPRDGEGGRRAEHGGGGGLPRAEHSRTVPSTTDLRSAIPLSADGEGSRRLHVAVLMGGWSAEREVSLNSGAGVAEALESLGHRVTRVDLTPTVAADLAAAAPDLVFNALHGTPGEDGSVQGLLELMGLRYTHSGLATSVIAIDKVLTKQVLVPAGVPMPGGRIVRSAEIHEADPLPRPYVLKPVNEGSSVGVAIVTMGGNYGSPIGRDTAGPWQEFDELLAEPYVRGRELTTAVLDGADGPRALGVTELRPKSGWYDYDAKYTDGMTEHLFPAPVPDEIAEACRDLALQAHRVLGCRGCSRSDFRWDDERGVDGLFLLEVNTQPGMTALSLVPEQARHTGMSYAELVQAIVDAAMRAPAPKAAARAKDAAR
ncbi:UDP-N-acetylenolpyruvoylglucosamine reductase [Sphingomonas sp. BK580]|nr:UDP-N-acetylenolpyruvoylglucosamine reductase [Sphingomonas sp. BK580]